MASACLSAASRALALAHDTSEAVNCLDEAKGPDRSLASRLAQRRAQEGHDLYSAVVRGQDPAAEKQEKRRRANSTLRSLLAEGGDYERHLKRRHIVNTRVIMSTLRRGLGRLMGKDVAAITRADFVTAIVAIEDQGKPGAAADLRKCARTFCEWCVHRGFAPRQRARGPAAVQNRLRRTAR